MASSSYQRSPVNNEDPKELKEVLIPANINSVDLAKRTLIGKLLTNKAQNRTVAKGIIAKANWSAFQNLQISYLGKNKFLFTFEMEKIVRKYRRDLPGTL